MLVIGAKEAEAGLVNVRSRADKSLEGSCSLQEFVEKLLPLIRERRLSPDAPAAKKA